LYPSGRPLPRTFPRHPHRSLARWAGGAGIFYRRLPRRPSEAEHRRSALGSGVGATTRVAGTTSVADTTASAGTARDTALAAGTMGVAAHRQAPLPPTVRKRAGFRLRCVQLLAVQLIGYAIARPRGAPGRSASHRVRWRPNGTESIRWSSRDRSISGRR
jgi:hypothetical protein